MAKILFLIAMLLASALNFARFAFSALILPQADFGIYTAIVGAVGLTSILISFGLVEATTKLYPRLWVSGRRGEVWQDAKSTARMTGLRVSALAAVALVIVQTGLVDRLGIGSGTVLVLAVFVWTTSLLGICAAIIRAVGSVALLQSFAFIRGLLPLTLVAVAVYSEDWFLAILAEAVGAALVVTIGAILVRRAMTRAAPGDAEAAETGLERDNRGGREVFFANLMSSSILLGDRAVITALLGPAVGGAYGVIALVVQAGNLLMNILSQKFGPDIIRAIHTGASLPTALKYLRFPAIILGLAALGVAVVLTLGRMAVPEVADYLDARGIGQTAILLAATLVFLQIFLLLEFAALAINNERGVLRSSALALSTCAIGFALAFWQGWPLEAFIFSILLARIAQILSLTLALRYRMRR